MAQALALAGNNMEKLGALASAATAKGGVVVPGSQQQNGAQANVRFVNAPKVGGGLCGNYAAQSRISSHVCGSLFSSTPQQAPQQVKGKQGNDGEPVEVEVDFSVEKDLCISDIELQGDAAAAGGARVYLYLPEGFVCTPEVAAAGKELYSKLGFMMQEVFAGSDGTTTMSQFYVYYDPDRSAIAFNRGGQLWFNAAVKVDTTGFKSPLYGLARFWYLVCCHELAHNQVKSHNSSFSDACSAITLQYAESFTAFAERFCGGSN